MNISGIRPTESFYSYNSIKLSELRNQQIAAAKEASVVRVPKEADEMSVAENIPVQNYTSYDYAQRYNPDDIFELKGIDSDITNLDVQKAVSDLDKDQVLQQYQFFVGTALTPISTVSEPAPEKVLRSGENFYL